MFPLPRIQTSVAAAVPQDESASADEEAGAASVGLAPQLVSVPLLYRGSYRNPVAIPEVLMRCGLLLVQYRAIVTLNMHYILV